VRDGERLGNLRHDLDRAVDRRRILLQPLPQRHPVEQLHHDERQIVGRTDVMDDDDAGVREGGD